MSFEEVEKIYLEKKAEKDRIDALPSREAFLKEDFYAVNVHSEYRSARGRVYIPESKLNHVFEKEVMLHKGTRFVRLKDGWYDENYGAFEAAPDDWAVQHLENFQDLK